MYTVNNSNEAVFGNSVDTTGLDIEASVDELQNQIESALVECGFHKDDVTFCLAPTSPEIAYIVESVWGEFSWLVYQA